MNLTSALPARLIKKCIALLAVFLLVPLCGVACAQGQVSAEKFDSRIDIMVDGSFFTSYIFSHDEKYPFFYPVNGPSGASVTSMRNSNYPHHSSLFFGADRVNGGNYWQEGLDEGQIVSAKINIVQSEGDQVIIENECIWVRPDAESPIKDTRLITISAPGNDLYQIDFDVTVHALQDVTIERTNHSLFSGRMDPDLAVINGGTMINAEGDQGEDGTFGVASPWIDYYGERAGGIEGMAIMQHPSNEWYPAPWFTRNYGFFSPTPLYWPEDADQGTTLQKGDAVELRYRVIVHAGNHEEANIADRYEEYERE